MTAGSPRQGQPWPWWLGDPSAGGAETEPSEHRRVRSGPMGAGMIPPGADGSGGHLVDWDFHGAELGSSGGTTTAEESPGAVSGRKPQACLSWREGTFKSKEQEDTHAGAPAHWSSAPKAAVNLSVQKLCFIWEPRTGVGGCCCRSPSRACLCQCQVWLL